MRLTLVAALLAASCATPTPTRSPTASARPSAQVAGTDCAAFAPDPSDAFFTPVDVSYQDPTALGWPTGTPADVGLDASLLGAAADNVALSADVRSLLVVRHGKLVFERYFNDSDAGEANLIASVSKSILSVATGIAIDDGLLELDMRIDEFLPPDMVGEHGDLTVENLLTMSGGLALSEDAEYLYDVVPSDLPGEPSFVRAVLTRESVAPAGAEFAYSTGLTQVLAALLTEATGQSLCAYVTDRLLGPLGIDVETWWVEPDGYFAGGHSVFITPREMARFGQLVLQHGQWGGEQLVSSEWLDQSLAERWDLGCRGVLGAHQGYGMLWWLYNVDGYQVWNASGYGAQELWIAPDIDLLIVVTHDATRVGEPDRHEVAPGAVARAAILRTLGAPRPPRCPPFELLAHTMRPDGSDRAPVAGWPAGGVPGSWSSDGSRLAIQLDRRDLNTEIYTIAPDGTDLTRLTRDLASDTRPALSPDGTRIAFARGDPSTTDLYLVNRDGADLARLTDFGGFEHSPTWSPDGTRIAFVWGHDEVNGFGETGALWAIDPEGSNRALLLDRQVGYPAWSPDGTRIALELRDDDHIGVLDLTTGAVTDLGAGHAPRWSPDGTRMAFIRAMGDALDIYVIRADGTDVVQLTDDPAFDTFPIWSPDGTTILFMSSRA
ncbi:MAG TPA: serine hydrolase [Candidatus Limnocylindrales bacterium]|nr:serine hydrolase [Candidatus Limnocylindrales bacterium]